MNRQAIQTRYLLGKLSDTESASLEEQSFVDDNVFDEIEIAEDELIDAYVGGSLSAEDRERFENKLLRSERIAERVEFARLLSESRTSQVMVHEPAKRSWLPGFLDISFSHNPALTGAAVTALFLVVLGLPVFLWLRTRFEGLNMERATIEKQREAIEQKRAAIEERRRQLDLDLTKQEAERKQLDQDLQDLKAEEARVRELRDRKELLARANREPVLPTSPPLFPGIYRSSGQPPATFRFAPTATSIGLKLVLDTDEDYDEYIATIRSAAGENVLDEDLKTTRTGRSKTIVFKVEAKKLPPGYYTVKLWGRTRSGTPDFLNDYEVQVVKK